MNKKLLYLFMSKEGVQDIIRIFTEENIEICFVGGCIRDVLAGIIGGLIAQRVPLLSAAILGVYIHSRSASNVSENVGVSGLLASDLLPEIPVVMEKLRRY